MLRLAFVGFMITLIFQGCSGQELISKDKSVTMSSGPVIEGWDGADMVDGDYRTDADACFCCAGTHRGYNSWIQIDLQETYVISRIVLRGRTDKSETKQSLDGMKILFDNKQVASVPQSSYYTSYWDFNVIGIQLARYVKFTHSEDMFVILCETDVYGCPLQTYGETCSELCGSCRNGATCNVISGHCEECQDGYTNLDLSCNTACLPGQYGYNCSKTCGNCSGTCDKGTGHCDYSKCTDGYYFTDPFCKTECNDGRYGANCAETCGKCRDNEVCNKVNGLCARCLSGYNDTDLTCKTLCPNGTYGNNCLNKCGKCKNNSPCNQTTGLCKDCDDGFVVDDYFCSKVCQPGTYGYNCTKECGHCFNGDACHPSTGHCTNCGDGFDENDPLCKTMCGSGSFGSNCSSICGYCFGNETCNHVNGTCTKCMTGYVLPICAESLDSLEQGDDWPIVVIIAPVIAFLIVTCTTVIVIVIFRRRRLGNKEEETEAVSGDIHSFAEQPGNVYANSILEGYMKSASDNNDSESDYYNFNEGRSGIAIENLWEYIYSRKRKDNKHFENEFGLLKDGLVFPHNDALANPLKNRYKKMFPYDHSRVHLKVEIEGESEFINASFIDGFHTRRKFIASQGPVKAMAMDFWRMVWQQNATHIVMLTNLFEAGNEKCLKYWPEKDSITFEKIKILMVNEVQRHDFTVRTLDIKQGDETCRRIRQYHYRAWPDKDVPDSTWSLLQFWREVFKDYKEGSAPVIVHCSAGVGRTGTFIALDNLHHQARTAERIDPFGVVEKLRNQRVKMVQTLEQYEYLHHAAADSLLFAAHFLWQSQFSEYYDFMIKMDKDKKTSRMKLQFGIIERSVKASQTTRDNEHVYEDSAINLEINEYRPKKRWQATANRLQLSFVALPGLKGVDLFLVTDVPDDGTFQDCLNLIKEYSVGLVITVAENSESIWSSPKTPHIKYHLEISKETKGNITTERMITYKPEGSSSNTMFIQIESFISTNMSITKEQLDRTIVFLDKLCKKLSALDARTCVLVQCSDGEDGYGSVLCALLNEMMRMKNNGGQINIFETVMLMKRRNKGCIQTYDQYKYIHDVILHMVENIDSTQLQDDCEDNIYQNT